MSKEIIINAGAYEKRIALMENGKLSAYHSERPEEERTAGNIYLGFVKNINRGIQAAFIDIGAEQAAFMTAEQTLPVSLLEDSSPDKRNRRSRYRQIEKMLKPGQPILVQVIKESIGKKGPKVTMQVSLAGRFIVLLSGTDFIGISRKTRNYKERQELKDMIDSVKPRDVGVIVRTIGLEAGEKHFKNEIKILNKKYQEIIRRAKKAKKPMLLHKDVGFASSAMRELFTREISRVVVDSKKEFKEIQTYLKSVDPEMRKRVFLHKSQTAIFDEYGIEKEVDKIIRRKVWLKSGGYLIFDHAEALTAIDVNTGRVGAKKADAIYHTNLEAAREIARQVLLRDIGGLIVIDFIDMKDNRDKESLYREFYNAMRIDKNLHHIGHVDEFGLIHMSRKRVRVELMEAMSESCPACGGTGTVFSPETIIARIDRFLQRNRAENGEKNLQLEVSAALAEDLTADDSRILKKLSRDNKTDLSLFLNDTYRTEVFRIYEAKTSEDITDFLAP